jgi:hypothetical protein
LLKVSLNFFSCFSTAADLGSQGKDMPIVTEVGRG